MIHWFLRESWQLSNFWSDDIINNPISAFAAPFIMLVNLWYQPEECKSV